MKSFKKIKMVFGLVGLFIFLTTSFASAEVIDKSDQWKSFVSFYGWANIVNGDVKVKGLESDISNDFDDFWSNSKFFFGVHYEGFKGQWGLMLDGFYNSFEAEKEHPGGALPGRRQMKFNQTFIELAIPYRLTWNPVVADVFIGGRFNNIYTEIAIPSAAVKRDDTLAFLDPIVGGRVFIPMSKTWFFGLRGDIGGFGIGNASDLALNGSAFFNWQITRPLSMQFGYRALYIKYNEGEKEWKGTQHGPWLGLGFSF
jgi:hypothetical protein